MVLDHYGNNRYLILSRNYVLPQPMKSTWATESVTTIDNLGRESLSPGYGHWVKMEFLSLLTGKDTAKVVPIDSKIRALAFLPDGCIVSGEESSVQLRHPESLMGEPIGESSTGVLAVATSKDGSRIVTGTTDGLAIWSKSQSTTSPVLVKRHSMGGVRTIDISSDSKWAVTGSDARTADVWDMSTGERRSGLGPLRHEYDVIAVKFCPCGERLATATLFGSVRIFAISSGKKILTIPISVTAATSSHNVTFAWFAHRPQIFAVSQGQIKCLNSDDGSLIYQWALRGVTHPSSVALSPNSKLIAYSINDTVILRDTATRQEIGGSLKHDGNVTCIAFSRGSDLLVTGADAKFTIWNLRRLLTDTSNSYFTDTTGTPKSCTHHKEDPTRKSPPTTFSLPLMSISNPAVKGWLHGFLDHVEKVLSEEIEKPDAVPNHDTFANRALIRGRLGNGNAALEDANKSLSIRPSPIGEIAKTIAFIKQKQYMLAKQEIPKVLQSGHSDQHTFLLEVIQSILSCLAGEYETQVSHINRLSGDKKLLWLVQANMHLSEKSFESAMESFNKARMPAIFPHDETREMWTILFVFGWKFSGLAIQIQQKKCEFLLDAGDPGAADLFVKMKGTYQREIAMHVELADWSSKFRNDCLAKLENLGNQALAAENWSVAIKYFIAVEPLIGDLDAKHELLLKRSRAHSNIPDNWELALQDAEAAIRLNSTSPWGYDMKHTVLYARRHYHEAAEALDRMLVELTFSKDAKSTALREKGVNPGETKKIINGVVEETLAQPRPHVLINTESGRLCDRQKQMEAFKADPRYKDLVLSPTSGFTPDGDWKDTISRYFRYSTLSHTWESEGEPEYRVVKDRAVETLDQEKHPTPIQKLQTYCRITHELEYLWAWSDTCCINKDEREVLDVALRSMYRWYSESSLTIVHLKGVYRQLAVDLAELEKIVGKRLDKLLEEFVDCRWNKRAWTLQEYFASRIIHFYTEDWKPYLPISPHSDNPTNHKETRAIQRGMELVTKLDKARLAALKPGTADVREKLRLASTRQATRKEDVAYSLLGVFKVTIEAIYGDDEAPRALGRLLEALLTQSADVSILAWTGSSSEYNTCLPAEITVYQHSEARYLHEPIVDATLAASVSAMQASMAAVTLSSAIRLHDRLLDAPPPELHHGRLKLSCILFQVPSVTPSSKRHTYTTTVEMLGRVEIETQEDLTNTHNMFLVNPWFRRLMNPGIPLSESARQESALKLLASLKQPFGALLLACTSRDYERIATDKVIKVKILESISLDDLMENIRVTILYIR